MKFKNLQVKRILSILMVIALVMTSLGFIEPKRVEADTLEIDAPPSVEIQTGVFDFSHKNSVDITISLGSGSLAATGIFEVYINSTKLAINTYTLSGNILTMNYMAFMGVPVNSENDITIKFNDSIKTTVTAVKVSTTKDMSVDAPPIIVTHNQDYDKYKNVDGSFHFFAGSGTLVATGLKDVTLTGIFGSDTTSTTKTLTAGQYSIQNDNIVITRDILKDVNIFKVYQLKLTVDGKSPLSKTMNITIIDSNPVKYEVVRYNIGKAPTSTALVGVLYSDGLFEVTGTGAMSDYTKDGGTVPKSPWRVDGYYYYIKTIRMKEGVTSVGDYAFYNSFTLEQLHLANTIKTIGISSFESAKLVKELNITDSITTIGLYAFKSWSAVETIRLGSGLLEANSDMFSYATVLKDIYIYNPTINLNSLYLYNKTIYGYAGSTAEENAALRNCTFKIISENVTILPTVAPFAPIFDKEDPKDIVWDYTQGDPVASVDIYLDNILVDPANYNTKDTLITFTKEYLTTLDNKTYQVKFTFDDTASTEFIDTLVVKDKISPEVVLPTVIEKTLMFDKNEGKNLIINFTYGSEADTITLTGLDTDAYNVIGNTIVLYADNLNMLSNNNYPLVITFNDTADTSFDVMLTITGNLPIEIVPPIIEQQNVKYVGSDISYTIAFSSSATTIAKVFVNGEELPEGYFSVTGNNLTISNDYLSVINNGLYKITLEYNDGSVVPNKLTFTVPKDTSTVNPSNSILNVIYVTGGNKNLNIPLTNKPTSVNNLYINSNLVDTQYYTYTASTGILSISSELLNSLGLGSHTIVVNVGFEVQVEGFNLRTSFRMYANPMVLESTATISDLGIIVASISDGTSGLTYKPGNNDDIIIDGSIGDDTSIVIPPEIDGKPVTGIEKLPDSTTDVSIPGSVTDIDDGAIPPNTEIIAPPGSAGEDYAGNNGNPFTPTTPGGIAIPPSIPQQNPIYDLNNKGDIVILGVQLGDATGIDYIILNGYKIFANGEIVTFALGDVFFTLDSNGNLVINKELLETLGLVSGDNYQVTVGFNDGTENTNVSINVVDNTPIPGKPTIKLQTVIYDKSTENDVIITDVNLGNSTKVNMLMIGSHLLDQSNYSLNGTVMPVSGSAISVLDLDLDTTYNMAVMFDDNTLVVDKVFLDIIDSSVIPPTGTPEPTPVPPTGTPTPPIDGGGGTTPTPTPPVDGGGTTPTPITPKPTTPPDTGNGGNNGGNGNGGNNGNDNESGGNSSIDDVFESTPSEVEKDDNSGTIDIPLDLTGDEDIKVSVDDKELDSSDFEITDDGIKIKDTVPVGEDSIIKITVGKDGKESSITVAVKNLITFKSNKVLYIGDVYKLNKTFNYFKGNKITYTSANTKVAKVSKYGNITPIKKGTTTVTITYNVSDITFKEVITIKVVNPVASKGKIKVLTRLSLTKNTATINFNKNLTLGNTLDISLKDHKDYVITYKTGNTKKATVKDGKIKAVGKGNVDIYVTVKNKNTGKQIKYILKITVVK